MCHYKQILEADRDQTAAKEALEHFQLLVDIYPQSPYSGKALCKISEAQQRIAEHEFFVGNFYFKKQDYDGAAERYTKILKKYPHALKRDRVLYYLADATIQSGKKQRGIRILKLLRYPESNYSAEAKSLLDLTTTDG